MKRSILKLLLPAVFLFLLTPTLTNRAGAALADTTLGESHTTSTGASVSYSADGDSITCSASGYWVFVSVASTLTITLTNNRESEANLAFNYDVSLGGGSLTVAGTSVTTDGMYPFSKKLSANESIQIVLKSKKGSGTSSLSITGLSLSDIGAKVDVKFLVPNGGTYTVNETSVEEEISITKLQTEEYRMVATPASGYKFVGWYDVTNDTYKSYDLAYNSLFNANVTMQPIFVLNETALFEVGGQRFLDLNDANDYACTQNERDIFLISTGVLSASDEAYVISAGKRLVIPFNESYSVETTPGIIDASTPTEFRRLTLRDGAKIECDGIIYVGGQINAANGGSDARSGTTGSFGRIHLDEGSSITVNTSGTLYSYGFITGEGTVTAKGNGTKGATVYEIFELREFRGGTITMAMQGNSYGVLPFSQYYFQNIGARLVMEAGMTLKGYTAANVVISMALDATILGPDEGIFVLEEGTVTKWYDLTTDRCKMEIDGSFHVGRTRIEKKVMGYGIDIETSDYVMPINGQFDIHIKNDSKVTIPVDVELLPGATMTIDPEASVTVGEGTNLYLYDSATWCAQNYVFSGKTFAPAGFYPDRVYTRTAEDLVDAKIVVNGTLWVNGNLYTTTGGANITSDGNGVVSFVTNAGSNRTIYQSKNGNEAADYVAIDTTSAQLRNSDASYVNTTKAAAGIEYTYRGSQSNGAWISNAVAQVDGGRIHATLQTAVSVANGALIIMLADTTESGFATDKSVVLDLNGNTVTLKDGDKAGTLTVTALHGMDSKTNSYGINGEKFGTIKGTVNGTVEPIYNHVVDENINRAYLSYYDSTKKEYSFHRVSFGVESYTYYTDTAGKVLDGLSVSTAYMSDEQGVKVLGNADFGMAFGAKADEAQIAMLSDNPVDGALVPISKSVSNETKTVNGYRLTGHQTEVKSLDVRAVLKIGEVTIMNSTATTCAIPNA